MTITSKILTHLSGSTSNPQKWNDLSRHEKYTAKSITGLYVTTAFGLAVYTVAAIDEIKNTPDGCRAIIAPEQTFTKQPEHCRKARDLRIGN